MSAAAGAAYEITVAGHLDGHWSERLGGLRVVHGADGTTTLTGVLADQAQLHGVISGLRDIGAVLHGVRRVGPDVGVPAKGVAPVEPALNRVLQTERLTLRPGVVDDADATWAYRRLPAVDEWLGGCPDTRDGYRALFAEPSRLAATVVVQLGHGARGPVVGDLMLRREDAWAQHGAGEAARGAQVELGWVLDPAYMGHGYATEAVRELIRYAFGALGVRRVVASCFLDNTASWRLMERVGMRREVHAVRESLHRSGRWLDTVGYALLAEEQAGELVAGQAGGQAGGAVAASVQPGCAQSGISP